MARIYQVLQRQSDKRWDMTVSSDEEGWAHPIGYCTGWRGDPDDAEKERLTKTFGEGFVEGLQREWDQKRSHKDKFHRDGHATAEEAEACWRAYRFDTELRFHESTSTQKVCQVCGVWTPKYAELGHEFPERFDLCDAHLTRECVEQVFNKKREERLERKRNVSL